MVLEQKLNEKGVILRVTAHSLTNGAAIPETAVLTVTSNAPEVATAPDTIPIPSGGQSVIDVAITQVGVGTADFLVNLETEGGPFNASATLILLPVSIPGIANITAELVQVEVNPT